MNTPIDGLFIDPQSPSTPAFLDDLDTHPEFANVDTTLTTDPTTPNDLTFMGYYDLGTVVTFFPRFLHIPGPDGPSDPHWVLAAGSGTIYFPQDVEGQVDMSWWPDLVFRNHAEFSMVRVYDAQDPSPLFDQDRTTAPPSYTLIGPRTGSNAYLIEPFEWESRNYLVVSDIAGAIQLWDLTDLLDPATPAILHPDLNPLQTDYGHFMLEEWRTPECVSDDLSNSVYGLAVHLADTDDDGTPDEVQIYVAVARVGIEVLRFDPTGTPSFLEEYDHIETPSGSAGIRIRELPLTGEIDLLVSERNSGLRVFERP